MPTDTKDTDLTSAPPTGAEILADAERVSGAAQDTDECIAVALLITSAFLGPKVRRCAAHLGLPLKRVGWMANNLRNGGVWGRDKVYGADWADEEHGGMSLNLDACVAIGWMTRTKARRHG